MIRDGWICRACWKPNRAQDDRCYRCKTPRDQQLDVAAGSLKETSAPEYANRGRMDMELGLLAAVVAWPTWLSGWLGIIGGVLTFLLALLGLAGGQQSNALILGITGAILVLLGWLVVFLARSVRRHARWAYAIVAFFYLVGSVPWFLGLGQLPPDLAAQVPDWYVTVQNIWAGISLVLGIGALVLLITSFMRRGTDEPTPRASTETG